MTALAPSSPLVAPLSPWQPTATSLHRAAQLLGALQLLARDQVPNYLELSLAIRPQGLSTGPLPGIGEVVLDMQRGNVIHRPTSGADTALPLAGRSQAALLEALLAAMAASGQAATVRLDGRTASIDALLAALQARHHPLTPQREDLADETILEVDPAVSAGYAATLDRVFTATARFRARLTGPMTHIVVWPEHFDLSFLWFATNQATDNFPHMNFGFAPFSDDIARPYLYAYAYPMPVGFEALPLPPAARWHTEGWHGVVVPYDELSRADDPQAMIENTFTAIYALLAPTLGATTPELQ
jgi:hypothetical protein